VEEAFVARREAKRLYVVPQRRQALEKLVLHATSLRIPVVEVEGGTLTAIAGFDGHQGIALIVAPRRWASPEDVLAVAVSRHEPPLVLVLDSLEDPQNVGTLLRTAEASGVHGAIFPTRHQAPLSPAAVKASAGAVEHLALAPVDDLPGTLADLHARGLRIVGADGEAPLTARDADLRGPIAIVVGSEGKGLGPAIRRRCDLVVRIPMHGRIESLNASVAGSILLYEAAAQRRLPDPGPRAAEGSAQAGDAADETLAGKAGITPGPEPQAGHDAEPLTGADAKPATATARVADAGVVQASPSDRVPELPTADDGTSEAAAAGALASEPDPAATDAQGKAKAKRTRRAKPVEAEPAPSPDLADLLPEAPAAAAPEV
jgi:23S rRNA (guanosine2251-2'-O)-methyltransferase